MITTLQKILDHDPCECGWKKLLAHMGKTKPDNEPLSLEIILESNGIKDAIWALRTIDGYDREIRLFACWCARQSLYLFEREYPNDMRPRIAIEMAELFAEGLETKDAALSAACAAHVTARDVSRDTTCAAARAASCAAHAAACAADYTAGNAAWNTASIYGAAVYAATHAAARDATWAAARDAAGDAAWAAAWAAIWNAIYAAQAIEYKKMFKSGHKYPDNGLI